MPPFSRPVHAPDGPQSTTAIRLLAPNEHALPAGVTGDLSESLRDLAELAAQTIPGNDGAGVTIIQDGASVYRSSNGFATAVDHIQYRLGEGPCIEAVENGQTVVSGRLGAGEDRWPQFATETLALKVRSVLSLPLLVADSVIGSVNVYAQSPNAFDAASVAAGESFAGPAAASLSTAHLLVETLDLAAFAGYALADRARLETATGILRVRHSLTADAARHRLATIATASGATVAETASQIIADAQQRPAHP